jgi:hypothetical protein
MTAPVRAGEAPSLDVANIDLRIAGLTALIVFGATVVLNKLIPLFGLQAAQELAGAPLAGAGVIYSVTRSRITGRGGLTPAGIVPLRGYEVPWPTLVILSGLTIVGVANIGSFLGSFLTGSLEAGLGAGLATGLAAAAVCGRLIGIRSDRHALVAAILAAVLAQVIGNAVTFLLVPEDLRSQFGISLTTDYLVPFAISCALYATACAIGAALGRRNREGGYLSYLLKRLEPATRSRVIEIVYDKSLQQSQSLNSAVTEHGP